MTAITEQATTHPWALWACPVGWSHDHRPALYAAARHHDLTGRRYAVRAAKGGGWAWLPVDRVGEVHVRPGPRGGLACCGQVAEHMPASTRYALHGAPGRSVTCSTVAGTLPAAGAGRRGHPTVPGLREGCTGRCPVTAVKGTGVGSVSCGSCLWRISSGYLDDCAVLAAYHESGNVGHQVTVWDTHTSQVPRDLWLSWSANRQEARTDA